MACLLVFISRERKLSSGVGGVWGPHHHWAESGGGGVPSTRPAHGLNSADILSGDGEGGDERRECSKTRGGACVCVCMCGCIVVCV